VNPFNDFNAQHYFNAYQEYSFIHPHNEATVTQYCSDYIRELVVEPYAPNFLQYFVDNTDAAHDVGVVKEVFKSFMLPAIARGGEYSTFDCSRVS
ncbi:MAG: hypothetical protein ACRC1M_06315, partial [Methanobacteriaceae archaeon]